MKKANTVSFIFPEEKYRLPDTKCSQPKLLSYSPTQDPSNKIIRVKEKEVIRSTIYDNKSPIVRASQVRSNDTEARKELEGTNGSKVTREATTTTTIRSAASITAARKEATSIAMARKDASATASAARREVSTNTVKRENNSVTTKATKKEVSATSVKSKIPLAATVMKKEQIITTEKEKQPTIAPANRKESIVAGLVHMILGSSNKFARIVEKNGHCNVNYTNVPGRYLMFLSDYFTSVLEMRWRFLILLFLAGFVISWLLFSGLWFALANLHGDLGGIAENTTRPTPCIWNAENFASVLLFSMETQTTIGYGYRYVSEECPVGIILLIFQSICGLLLQVFLAGSVLTKIQVPKKRAKTIEFSKRACISIIHGEPCFMIRIGNLRSSEVVEASLRALFVLHKDVDGKEIRPHILQEMRMGSRGELDSRLTLWWPSTIFHKINKSSPLFKMTPDEMEKCEFEVIIIMEGVISSTSLNFQARTSYIQNEIVWGFEFVQTFQEGSSSSKFPIDFKLFDDVTEAKHSTRLSAEEYLELRQNGRPCDQANFCVLD